MERLRQFPFQDRARASREIGELTRCLPPATLSRLDLLLSVSPAPEEGLRDFIRLLEAEPSWFQRLTRSTSGLRNLVAVFTHSRFLADEIFRHPEWAERLLDAGALHGVVTPERLQEALEAEIGRAHV